MRKVYAFGIYYNQIEEGCQVVREYFVTFVLLCQNIRRETAHLIVFCHHLCGAVISVL